jgi:hypothetical protein
MPGDEQNPQNSMNLTVTNDSQNNLFPTKGKYNNIISLNIFYLLYVKFHQYHKVKENQTKLISHEIM